MKRSQYILVLEGFLFLSFCLTSGCAAYEGNDDDSGSVDAGEAFDGSLAQDDATVLPFDATLCAEPPGNQPNVNREVFRFEMAPNVVVKLGRLCVGTDGRSCIFEPQFLAVQSPAGSFCVDGESIEYTNTHHNWLDEAATVVDGKRFLLEFFTFDGEETNVFHLRVFDDENDEAFADSYALDLTGGPPGYFAD